jgi:HEAT repeat protein
MRRRVLALLLLVLVGTIAWLARKPFLIDYYVRGLSQADEAGRASWVESVIGLDEAAVPTLLEALANADSKTCGNLEFAFAGLARKWGPDDARTLDLLTRMSAQFTKMSVVAKTCVLEIPIALLQLSGEKACPPEIARLAGELVQAATADELRLPVLRLGALLLERVPAEPWLDTCRDLALRSLGATEAASRVAALVLIRRGPLRKEQEVLTRIVPFLKDAAAPVRRNALLIVGQARELVSDDDLMPLLHDGDEEVQELCEIALRGRGLLESHILLARLISDARPESRLQVLRHLRMADDLEPGVWLRRLCQDPAPAVRAAAIRAAAAQTQVDLRSCLAEAARQDPSLTVRQLAAHYLRAR